MNIYWVDLEVIFNSPFQNNIFGEDDTRNLTKGFFQNIGCTAKSEEELEKILRLFLMKVEFLDLIHDKYQYEISIISDNEIETEIYGDPDLNGSLISDPLSKGIWYHTGRMFYWDGDETDEFYEVEITKIK